MISGRESSVSTTEGRHLYTLQAWADRFQSWSRDLAKKFEAAQDISVDILVGVQLIEATAARTTGKDKIVLAAAAAELRRLSAADIPSAVEKSSSPELKALMIRHADRRRATSYGRELAVMVDRDRARFSAWYEMFPRSSSPQPGRARNFAGLRQEAGLRGGNGFRRSLPSAHSPHRPRESQGKEQR